MANDRVLGRHESLPTSCHNRRGSGALLVIVALFLLIFSVMASAMAMRSRGVTRLSERYGAGEEAYRLAQAAVTEAWAVLEAQANDGTTELGEALQAEHTKEMASSFTIDCPYTRACASKGGVAATFGPVTLTIVEQRPIWHRNELEKIVVVRAEASVTVDVPVLDQRATRKLSQQRTVKMVYPAPPRPLGSYTLFCLKPDHLAVYEQQYRAMQYIVEYSLRLGEQRLSTTLPRPFANNGSVYAAFPYFNYPPFPYNRRSPARSIPNVYDSFAASACRDLTVLDASHDPATSDLSAYLVSTEEAIGGEELRLQWPDIAQLDQGRPQDFIPRYEQAVRQVLSDYHRRFGFIARQSRDEFNECYLRPLLTASLDGVVSVQSAIAQTTKHRCTHVFPNEDALWDEVGRGSVFLDGIYFVDGPITVDMDYRGRGTIIGRNRITVHKCQKRDEGAICTIISFCDGDGSSGWQSIDLRCSPQAGLVALAGTVGNLHLHTVEGSVAVGYLDRQASFGDDTGNPYPWQIRHDENFELFDDDGQARYDRGRVVISPIVEDTCVARTL